ncbi:hypothetical protein GOP47_0016567 [Adiantum capillus-veneris]|uniref:RRM domain-containing protein n=1 Tax=Adiantum capillus-veneris TaxID=13818 RepID=A0A9D4UIB6_ADICA|nr:hypothetical protein GOP47_0016567 [Adiantum capillus-veneris]
MASEEEGGGLTFSLDVGSHGATVLRNNILNKLSEFMGSYTDDVLAEYVVVLVSHGKQRVQAIKDLEAFLGDRSEFFVTWLWEHLGSNMHLYTASPPDDSSPNQNQGENEAEGENEVTVEGLDVSEQTKEKVLQSLPDSKGGRIISLRSKPSESHLRRELKLNSSRVSQSGVTRSLSGSIRPAKRQRSPDSSLQSERVASEKQKAPRVSASMRLLQSAVREAVAPATGHPKRSVREAVAPATGHPKRSVREAATSVWKTTASLRASTAPTSSHSKWSESTLKRLQSVVSADFEKSEVASVQQPARRPKAARQSQQAVPAIMMAMKAAAAAAEDVTKVRGRHSGNIWDRLGKKSADSGDSKDEEYERYGDDSEEAVEDRYVSHYDDEQSRKRPRLDHDEMLSEGSLEDDAAASDSGFDKYTGQTASSRNVYAVQGDKYHRKERNDEGLSEDEVEDVEDIRARDRRRQSREESVTVEYRLARNMEGAKKEPHKQKGSSPASGLANSSQKIVNISVNVNTWKPGTYDNTGGSEQPAALPAQNQSQEQADKVYPASTPNGNELQEDGADVMVQPARELQQETSTLPAKPTETAKVPKPISSALPTGVKQTRKLDDAESRTVFVTNIHFAAPKESVMAHFASCGEIGRIVMLTDGATGQPKGSAYIEFKTKDATDRALALNDSSFYSRALKVVRKDAAIQAIQEMNPLIHPALIRRPIPIALRLPPGILRAPPYLVPRRFPPAMPRPYGNFPSLQWKRDGPASTTGGPRPGFNVPVRPVRSHSYVRSSGPQPPKSGEEPTPQQGEKEEVKMDVGGEKGTGDVQIEQG